RDGCALILSEHWPEKVGKGLMFISLNVEPESTEASVAALDALRAELEAPRRDGDGGPLGLPGAHRRGSRRQPAVLQLSERTVAGATMTTRRMSAAAVVLSLAFGSLGSAGSTQDSAKGQTLSGAMPSSR